MGFILSIVLLYFLGFISHYFYIWKEKRAKNKMWIVTYGIVVYLFFLIGDILMYANALGFLVDWYNQLPWVAATPFLNGPDFMWNGVRVIGIVSNIIPNSALTKFAVFFFLCYLPVYYMGKIGSQLLFGRRTYQRGAIWALTPS